MSDPIKSDLGRASIDKLERRISDATSRLNNDGTMSDSDRAELQSDIARWQATLAGIKSAVARSTPSFGEMRSIVDEQAKEIEALKAQLAAVKSGEKAPKAPKAAKEPKAPKAPKEAPAAAAPEAPAAEEVEDPAG